VGYGGHWEEGIHIHSTSHMMRCSIPIRTSTKMATSDVSYEAHFVKYRYRIISNNRTWCCVVGVASSGKVWCFLCYFFMSFRGAERLIFFEIIVGTGTRVSTWVIGQTGIKILCNLIGF